MRRILRRRAFFSRVWADRCLGAVPQAAWSIPPGLWCCNTGASQKRRTTCPKPAACLLSASDPLPSFSSRTLAVAKKKRGEKQIRHKTRLLSCKPLSFKKYFLFFPLNLTRESWRRGFWHGKNGWPQVCSWWLDFLSAAAAGRAWGSFGLVACCSAQEETQPSIHHFKQPEIIRAVVSKTTI